MLYNIIIKNNKYINKQERRYNLEVVAITTGAWYVDKTKKCIKFMGVYKDLEDVQRWKTIATKSPMLTEKQMYNYAKQEATKRGVIYLPDLIQGRMLKTSEKVLIKQCEVRAKINNKIEEVKDGILE